MGVFNNMSLRRKQTLVIMLTNSIALFLACAAFVTYDLVTFRKQLVMEVSILADAIGNNCAAAIDFNDPKAASETLAALQANSHIVEACVYSRVGAVFAVFQRDPAASFVPPSVQSKPQYFTRTRLHLFRPIKQKSELIGTIYVSSDLKHIWSRLARYMGIVALVFLLSMLVALALSSQLQRLVVSPVLHLAKVARWVASEKEYSVRATKHSNDELGQLVDGFNEMLAQIQSRDIALQNARDELEKRVAERTAELEETHNQLLKASRRGGMAEIATNVLHNVGNVLNSVNVSTTLILESVKTSRAPNLAKVVVLLQEHTGDLGVFITQDAKGRQLPGYLSRLSEYILEDQKAMMAELDSLRRNVEHIKEIVAMQQSYATFGGVKEVTDLVELVEEGLRLNEGSLIQNGIKVVREFENVPPLNLEKHKTLQILVNLIRNAKHACLESDRTDKRLTVRVTSGVGSIKITVTDNGVGIPKENLTRIFSHGFTTRKGGHGFGLHSGALAAREMSGSLSVLSDGPGKGAAFTLELPVKPA